MTLGRLREVIEALLAEGKLTPDAEVEMWELDPEDDDVVVTAFEHQGRFVVCAEQVKHPTPAPRPSTPVVARPDERQFPVLRPPPGAPRFLPWAFLEPHEAQARANHRGQDLIRLAGRGGLGVAEILKVVRGERWTVVDMETARDEVADVNLLLALVEAWRTAAGA